MGLGFLGGVLDLGSLGRVLGPGSLGGVLGLGSLGGVLAPRLLSCTMRGGGDGFLIPCPGGSSDGMPPEKPMTLRQSSSNFLASSGVILF